MQRTCALVFLLALWCEHAGALETLQYSDVQKMSQAFGDTFRDISCQTMRTGVDCDTIGLEQVLSALRTPDAGFKEFRIDPQEEWLDESVSEIKAAFDGAANALRQMARDIEKYLIERLIIEGLTEIDHNELPKFDASHPHWLEDLTSTEVENTDFFVPVGQSSVLLYPKGVNKDDRQVKASANASVGLEVPVSASATATNPHN